MSREDVRTKMLEASARGYCTKRNENKVLDGDLLEDVVDAMLDSGIGTADRFEIDPEPMKAQPFDIKAIDYKAGK